MNRDIITLAQMSDIHLDPIPAIPPRLFNMKRAAGLFNWRRNRAGVHDRATTMRVLEAVQALAPDHICVTGDLINLGLPEEMEIARRWLEMVGPPERVSVVPGNHDIYSSIGDDVGLARWRPWMEGVGLGGHPLPYVRRLGAVALIGVNSAIETAPFKAVGRLGDEQRARLGHLLEALGRERAVRVVMIHHPPLPGQSAPAKALLDAAELGDLLTRYGAELVIHGHNHRFMSTRWPLAAGGTLPIIGIPSASVRRPHGRDDLARAHLFRIAPDRSITLESHGLLVADGPVVHLGTQALS